MQQQQQQHHHHHHQQQAQQQVNMEEACALFRQGVTSVFKQVRREGGRRRGREGMNYVLRICAGLAPPPSLKCSTFRFLAW